MSLASLPTRLQDWRLAPNHQTFAFGGDEVNLSIWDTESTFSSHSREIESTSSKKRKRDNALLPGEIWRAYNVHNDSFGLRQPIRITSLSYLPSSSGFHHVITGTQLGDVRRYDARAGRRPVSDWKIGKVGGVKTLENGIFEHQVFVSDYGYNLWTLDMRNGQIIYGYRGLSGAVTSIASSPSVMASTALDRYTRIHSTFPPPKEEGKQQERKGDVLAKIFMNGTPTVIAWDQNEETNSATPNHNVNEDDIWENMDPVEDMDEATSRMTTKILKRSRLR
ncbi:hypothetical protein BDZ94DRAFT_1255604 [Collybia nuda]|uniref:Ribosome biogenesis protein NSA1 n=1 Tax=Collybia nuda TaxID=64659 RepID=A0A9P5YB64_9AGAR|nr:hypothetical protein BDZ94DRAFT_1255604 [Collybia nuda]